MQSRLLLLRASGGHGGAASRRVRLLLRQVLPGRPGGDRQRPEVRLLHAGAGADTGDTVNIGDVSYKLKTPKNPELVNYVSSKFFPSIFIQNTQDYITASLTCIVSKIRSGSCAVRAATEGRTLILEGLEKAERNVLPVLNNLLENREMQLEDGRFLMSAERYDKLLQDHTKTELDAWKIVRVSENFRVIALGLPVPRYSGNPLDPPLRSRFQARDIYYLPFKDQLKLLYSMGANVSAEKVSQLLSFATTLCSQESSTLGLPDFPLDSLPAAVQILDSFPMMSIKHAIQWLYPYTILLGHEGKMAVEGVLKRFELQDSESSLLPKEIVRVERITENHVSQAYVTIRIAGKEVTIKVPSGTRPLSQPCESDHFIQTLSHKQLQAEMMQSHMVKDICLIGGKVRMAVSMKTFVSWLLDMTARDLLQQRYTLPNGDTAWRSSPLVHAALEGKLVLLDGIHRVNAGTLAVLQRLIHDRELSLYDGSRLLREDRYMRLKEELQMSDEQLQKSEEIQVIKEMVPNIPQEALDKLLSFTHKLRETQDPTAQSLAASLSTRQLLRISRRLSQYPNESLHSAVTKACLSRFLPSLARLALEKNLADASIEISTNDNVEPELKDYKCEIASGSLRIGAVSAPIYNAHEKMKVPDVLFYDNIQHMIVMEDMLKDFLLGEHLLLVGNQGVGKNKIVKAVKLGHVLVVDEADKAPTNVTCILKTLVENGEMILADGRRIVANSANVNGRENVVVIHPDFRMIVLANRPGFPFLGNDFFGTLGDIFSCHAVDNPKPHSELKMLRQYGPNVPEPVLQKLVAAFGELRSLADQGIINYPYSTREVVNIVKHLQKFPTEGLSSVVRNVFDFDSYNSDMREILTNTLHKYGIPIGAKPTSVQLAKE
uniref:von Willebrand factor A domain containing 8 n=1 Tax=Propithecus coquereli TaxID=379532 RepID=A0A2K6EZ92_PROCO